MTEFTTLQKITQVRLGGRVERCHTISHSGSYSVAAHSWGVAMLILELFIKNPECVLKNKGEYSLLTKALIHDIPEGWIGDIPATVFSEIKDGDLLKSKIAEIESKILRDLGYSSEIIAQDDEYDILKFCDCLELYLWCLEQRINGNQCVKDCMNKLQEFLDNLCVTNKPILPNGRNSFSKAISFYEELKAIRYAKKAAHEVSELLLGTYDIFNK